MSDFVLVKSGNSLIPGNEQTREAIQNLEDGGVIRAKFSAMRGGTFYSKWSALVGVAYEIWTANKLDVFHEGEKVEHSLDEFTKNITALIGYRRTVVNANNQVKLIATRIPWAGMPQSTFDLLYENTLDAILKNVSPPVIASREQLEQLTNERIKIK